MPSDHYHFGFQITQVFMYLNDEASSSAHYGVVYIENTFTRTSRRGVAYSSIISQIKAVFEFPLI